MRFNTTLQSLAIAGLVTAFGTVSYVFATEPAEAVIPLENLPAACRKIEFRPLTQIDIAQAKQELAQAIDRMDRRLAQDGANGAAWRKYLQSDALRSELRGAAQPDRALLFRIYGQYNAGHDGLELVWFIDVAQALRNYIAMLGAVGNPAIRTTFAERMGSLATNLQTYAAQPTMEKAQDIGDAVRFLQDSHQAPALVEAIQRHFVRPNLFAEISREVVGAGIAESVDDTTAIHDCILGTDVRGLAHTTGSTAAALSPHANLGVIDALFFGQTASDNVGCHGPVTIFSTSTTDLAACKRMWIDADGLSWHPAVAAAETQVNIYDIQSNKGRRLVERMAWRRAAKQQATAEYVASRHAEARLGERIDDKAAESLERANQKYVDKFQRPFSERRLFPQQLRFSTSQQTLAVVGLQAGGGKLAAPAAPPPVTAEADMTLRLHESAINNLTFDALAGRTLYEEKLQAAVRDALGHLPEKLKGDEDGKPWAITFAARQPISVSFANDGFKVTLRGLKYYKGNESYPGMNVSASYKIEKSPQGSFQVRVVRQGEIEVFPPDFTPGSGQLSARQQVLRPLLQKRFAKVFEPEFLGQGLELPGKWKAAGKLLPVEVVCRDGWLAIAWKRAATDSKPQNVAQR
jgi:hypothetical protein